MLAGYLHILDIGQGTCRVPAFFNVLAGYLHIPNTGQGICMVPAFFRVLAGHLHIPDTGQGTTKRDTQTVSNIVIDRSLHLIHDNERGKFNMTITKNSGPLSCAEPYTMAVPLRYSHRFIIILHLWA